MDKELKILMIEDVPSDAELAEREIKKAFIHSRFMRVETQERFIAALTDFEPDLIVSDYKMPAFNGLAALKIALEKAPLIPFIIYTGSQNEDIAVECMKAGATDYVIKEDRKRLIPAIQRALEIKYIKQESYLAHQNLVANEKRLRSLVTLLKKDYRDSEELLINILAESITITNSPLGYLYIYDSINDSYTLTVCSSLNIEDGLCCKNVDCMERLDQNIWKDEVSHGNVVIENNWSSSGMDIEMNEHSLVEINRFMVIPVKMDNVVTSVVVVANKPNEYQQTDVLQLTILMNSAWKILEQLEQEQEVRFLSTATEQSPVSIIITDINGAIKFVNNKFIDSTKCTKEELQGKILRIFRPGYLPVTVYDEIRKNLFAGNSWKGEVRHEKSTGSILWEEINVSTIKNSRGEITNYLVLSQDITSRKQMDSDLIFAKEKAEENDRLKTAFLNNLSHEIRTPLNAVVGFSQLINSSDQDVDQMLKYAEVIYQGSQQLLSIMDSIIAMAIIETGQLKINPVKTNLNRILNIVYTQLKQKAETKRLSFQSKALFSSYEAEVLIDETKVIQILSNIVENAIKYTHSGTVKFGCSVAGQELLFFIEDTGEGIAESNKTVIFERFRQGIDSPVAFQNGLGLGLSISKFYIEAMGGHIEVDSEINKGSRFTFSIPYKGVVINPINVHPNPLRPFTKKITILVVDDVELNARLIEEFVAEMNATVIYASNAREAIDLVSNHPSIDVVLMDIKMPGMDGYMATKEIKKIRPLLPVIAQTAYALAGDRQKSIEAGCDDYLSKPINRNGFFAVLNRILFESR